MRLCSVDGCGAKYLARGYCQNHYMQLWRAGSPLVAPKEKEPPQQYIIARTEKTDSGCWLWTKSTHNGYGKTGVDNRHRQAHVFSYEAFVGPVPKGMQVNHKCHNRACCNPEHLYAGTQKENVRDMFEAGRNRTLRGEESTSSKLKTEDVLFIRASPQSAKELRVQFGVSDSLIRAIRKYKTWAHI